MGSIARTMMLAAALGAVAAGSLPAQPGGQMTDSAKAERWQIENELASLAIIERKVMIPMRDGIRIPADIYRPKDTSKKYPIVWVRTPYNFNYWDVANGVPRNMTAALTAVKRGYAFVEMQEDGKIQVVLVLSQEDTGFLKDYDVEIGTQSGTQVQVFVPPDRLCDLAKTDEVLAINLPAQAVPQ